PTPGALLVNGIWGGVGTPLAQFGDNAIQAGLWSVATDPSGAVYVADTVNNRIQVFAPLGQFRFAFGSAGRGPGQFANPKGVAVDPAGNVYVADSDNDRVEKFGQTSGPLAPMSPTPEPNTQAPELGALTVQYRTFRPGLAAPGRRPRRGAPRG